jgi:molybdopterin converting factor small subunit
MALILRNTYAQIFRTSDHYILKGFMAKILFYGAFQAIAGQAAIEQIVPTTMPLAKFIDELIDTIPALKPALYSLNTETVRPEVLVLHNGELVREPATEVLVRPDDEIVIMHQIAGG